MVTFKLNSWNLPKALSITFFLICVSNFTNAQVGDTVHVDIAAIDQPIMYNRMGAAAPTGMIFALVSDIEAVPGSSGLKEGKVRLRTDKRPRPIVLRANKGNVLIINFTNYLTPYSQKAIVDAYGTDKPYAITQGKAENLFLPRTRAAGVHILGTEMADNISSDASFNGVNETSLAAPGESRTYTVIAAEEGAFLLYSTGADIQKGRANGGQLTNGLFGSLNIQPEGAEWYRSQVTEDLLAQTIIQWEAPNADPLKPNKIFTIDDVASLGIYNAKFEGAFPIINYNAEDEHGNPILKMYTESPQYPHRRVLIHTDLTAIITGPNAGRFPYAENSPSFNNVPASPDRRQPYREFSIHYHEAQNVVQAFPVFYTDISDSAIYGNITGTLSTGKDNFAINYGTGGIGAEIFANRIKVGPMADCADCAYEEFFLSSWAVGDPATVVDVPANVGINNGGNVNVDETLQNLFGGAISSNLLDTVAPTIAPGKPKAKRALYADDPSNVYHSYMNDHVKFRITHAGAGITHVHHQHAHQWLHSPNSDDGHYMDSQTINPGSSYTLEMVYNGSGNLNKTVGDQIFHCHFYPHFAAGMWSMWRVHDVLEMGTELDANLEPVAGSRALPDGEIARGTVIPGLVPMPTIGMAPMPGKIKIEGGQVVVENDKKSPGYPFFIPGIAGSRPPHPPLDFAQGTIYTESGTKQGPLNGGLPRNVIKTGNVAFENHTAFDWTKIVNKIEIIELPEDGTVIEKLAMKEHATRTRPSLTPGGRTTSFTLNGMPPVQGAPFADPAVDINGNAVGTKRIYKAAVIQLDVVLNKKGWHYPQQRMISLWGDVSANISGIKAPEPFFFRANTGEFVEFWHTNLVPQYYELDDYQVRTPTDIIGQHIHLVKFDVTSSDGAANGWNYEDGTLSPDVVRERIEAINDGGKHLIYKYAPNKSITDNASSRPVNGKLKAHLPNPVWGKAPAGQNWDGAQTTIQRWYADPLLNNKGEDRTVRTVFTHDHFGPSTHQQIGLYAGLLVEPNESIWIDPVTGDTMGVASGRMRNVLVDNNIMDVSDGGPTSWQANIVTKGNDDSYREFMLEFQDNQQAYLPGSKLTSDVYPEYPSNPTPANMDIFRDSANIKYKGWIDPTHVVYSPSLVLDTLKPQLVTSGGNGTYSVNYRSEPIPYRVSHDTIIKGDTVRTQSKGNPGDLAYAFSSNVPRTDPAFNTQPLGGSNISPARKDSIFKYPVESLTPGMKPYDPYTPLLRAYENDKIQVRTLVGAHRESHYFNIHGVNWLFEPSNENSGYRSTQNMSLSEHFEMNFSLPKTDTITDYLYTPSSDMNGLKAGLFGMMRAYDTEQDSLVALPNNEVSNAERESVKSGCPDGLKPRKFKVTAFNINQFEGTNNVHSLVYNAPYKNYDTSAVVYMLDSDFKKFKKPNGSSLNIEPLVLRANAGECIQVKLTNAIVAESSPEGQYQYFDKDQTFSLEKSDIVGMHAELLSYDVSKNDGANIGVNSTQTADTNKIVNYEWYAGKWSADNKAIPVEFGSVVLTSPDPLEQYVSGLFGALIVEPEGSVWVEDVNSHSSANVYELDDNGDSTLLFREFVLQFQNNLNVPGKNKATVDNAINYKSDPLAFRYRNNPNFNGVDVQSATSNTLTGTYPETPHLIAAKGSPVRVRLLHPGGVGNGDSFILHGHVWQEEPYINGSTELGHNELSQWFGFRDQLGALNSFDLLINSAGGKNSIEGDYLYRSFPNSFFGNGAWGIMSVTDGTDLVYLSDVSNKRHGLAINGQCSADPETGKIADSVTFTYGKGRKKVTLDVPVENGQWTTTVTTKKFGKAKTASVTSSNGGTLSLNPKELINRANGVVEESAPQISEPAPDERGTTAPSRRQVPAKQTIKK
jgi:hypothetical protein